MRGESAEDDRVHRTDTRTGEHGNRQFGTHSHVDGDAVAAFDSEAFQHIRETLHLFVQFAVGQLAYLARLAFPEQRDLIFACTKRVPVDAVVREI